MNKKAIKIFLFCTIIILSAFVMNVNAADFDSKAGFDVCTKAGVVKTFQILGYGLFVIKIIVPVILMGLGAMDFGKAVLASDENAIKNATNILIKRAIASVVIFFIPTLISAAMRLIDDANDLSEFSCLSGCVSKPYDSASCVIPNNIIFEGAE